MKNIIFLFLLALLSGCSDKKSQTNSVDKEQNQFLNISSAYMNTEISENKEIIIKLLEKSGIKLLNINNLFEISIPENIEIVTLNQYLFMDRDNTQYCIGNYLGIIYQNKYFVIRIDCYGDSNESILNGNETYNLRKIINPEPYKSRNEINFLKKNYSDDFFINGNGVRIGKSISNWGSGVTSDYYGLYFTLSNNEFNECVILIYNVWYSFAINEGLVHDDKNYKIKYMNEGGNLERIFQDLEFIENSITFTVSNDSIKIYNGSIGENIIDDELIFTTIDNLRMRKQPSLSGEILGYMDDIIYRVILIGEYAEIDGIKGNWVMVIPFNGNSISWVFNGFTRKPTEEEIWRCFGG